METFKIKAAQSPSETNCNFMSMVKAINADGDMIPLLTIMKGAQILHQHVSQELNLDPRMLLGVSESSYSNNKLALDYVKHFDKYTRERQIRE